MYSKRTLLKSLVGACFIIMLLLIAISRKTVSLRDYSLNFMGTQTNVLAIAKSEKTALAAIKSAEEQLKLIERLASYYDPNSQLSNINRSAFNNPVQVHPMLFNIIEYSMTYSKLSDGKFDVTIAPLIELYRNSSSLPTTRQIESVKARVGYDKLILDPAILTIEFPIEGMAIDLGAIAKGYAIDLAIEAMKAAGATGGLVDVGGDMRCFGKTERGSKFFNIGLQNPSNINDPNAEPLLLTFSVKNMSVATSGNYQRFIEIDGQRINHIFDPATKTGTKKYSSVSVIAPTAVDADALATTLSLVDEEKALEIVNSTQNTEALLIPVDTNKPWIKSAGINQFIK